MFRDSTQQTVARVTGDSPSLRAPGASLTSRVPRLTGLPKLEKNQGLIDFFTNNFICGDYTGLRNNLIWIPRNFNELLKTDYVKLSLQSCGAMAIARLRRSPEYVQEAHKQYSSALSSLTRMWWQDQEFDRDAFSMAAFFMSFFEVQAQYDAASRQSWRTHLNGIGSIFEPTDAPYLQSEFGARMYRMTRSQVLIHSLQSRKPVPEMFASSVQTPRCLVPPHLKPFDDADTLIARLANLQAEQCTEGNSSALVTELIALNAACCQWIETLPQTPWSFVKRPNRYQSGVWWDTREDIYSAGFIAHTYNKVRAVQIVAFDLVQDPLPCSSAKGATPAGIVPYEPNQEFSRLRMRELITDVCATIPVYHRPLRSGVNPSVRGGPAPLGTGFWFIWVLEVVGNMKEASPELVAWIVQYFERIHECTGFAIALKIAHRLREGHRGPMLP